MKCKYCENKLTYTGKKGICAIAICLNCGIEFVIPLKEEVLN